MLRRSNKATESACSWNAANWIARSIEVVSSSEWLLPSWIEFHNSTLTALNESASAREVVLDAYVRRWDMVGDRWHGTGWQQLVRIRIENVTDPSVVPAMP